MGIPCNMRMLIHYNLPFRVITLWQSMAPLLTRIMLTSSSLSQGTLNVSQKSVDCKHMCGSLE